MMGDSRNNSADSRIPGHGAVPMSDVIGQVRFVVMPFSRFRSIPSIDPHSAAVGMGSGTPDGAPFALGLLGTLPVLGPRRRDVEILPPPPRRRAGRRVSGPGGRPRSRDVL
jgi:signal peptidase I